jgi:glycosyltransferase involved in cell wall biosynthesis|tara:strand:+ start:1563 stop:2615 length:1053 start_codon:yes stop_codon:yes gene_type:complete
MKVRFYLNYEEDFRNSMNNYGIDHIKNLKKIHKHLKVSYFKPHLPKYLNFLPYLWRMRVARYFFYKLQIKSLPKVDVAHVVDHQYAHIVDNINAKRKIITVHDLQPIILQKRYNRNPLLFKYSIRHLNLFNKIITISNKSKYDLLKYTNAKKNKIQVLYQPSQDEFNNKNFNKKYIQRYINENRSIKILTYASAEYKNFDTSLKVLSRLSKKFPNSCILNFGKIANNPYENMKNKIIELPFMSRKNQNNIYRSADCLLFPSFFEGYGLPCVEAMNSNLPVISSNIPSIKEIMGNAGIYCKPLDVECFVKKITKLITNNKFYSKKKTQLKERKKFFDKRKYYKDLLKIYGV